MSAARPICTNAVVPLRGTAVVVLYGMIPAESPAYKSLIVAREELRAFDERISIILWDNSRSRPSSLALAEDVAYYHDPRNLGLAFAYNQALEIALRQESHWFITLDQDTSVPRDYLLRMASAAHLCACHPEIGAIVPQIADGTKRLSPHHLLLGAIPQWYEKRYCGVPREDVFAFNSGAMIRVKALQQIGGYDTRFPLEYSDTAMFLGLREHGKRVYINGDIQLCHEFSLIEMNRLLSAERYRRTLLAESALWDMHMSWLAGCERTARLVLRMVRHWMRNDRADLRRVTLEFLWFRLFRSKKTRQRRWNDSLVERTRSAPHPGRQTAARLRVSVCMAAYNGAEFIEAQIQSILPQLAEDDEIVIVDDASIDDTIACAASIPDRRIKLFSHERNEGVAATFEDALRRASGQILFLCDDDDLWAPTKVERVLAEFTKDPEVQIVSTRAALIDDHGARLADSRVNRHGRFAAGFWRNVLINHYQGSTMALRASLLGRVLPLPRRKSFLHDVWIGTRNDVAGGKTAYIDEPLLYYRRHEHNASQTHGLAQQIRIRAELLLAHLLRPMQSVSLLGRWRTH